MCSDVCTSINHRLMGRLVEAGLPTDMVSRVCAKPYHLGSASYPHLCTFCCDDREVHRVYGEDDLNEFLGSDLLVEGLLRTILRVARPEQSA